MASPHSYQFGDFGFGIWDFGLKSVNIQSAIPGTLWVPQSARVNRHRFGGPTGFTLVEMLVAMAITLVMMAAVVTLFANVSNSVRDRRATTEMSAQIRGVRNVLQQDLAGATCPGLTWQRPEANHGYIEIIEGPRREGDASLLIDADPNNPNTGAVPPNWPPSKLNPEIDHATSILPSSDPNTLPFKDPNWATDGGGLGDSDDILMLTVRNERKPFVGRSPTNVDDSTASDGDPAGFAGWNYEPIESPLAEVVWFSIENPGYTEYPAVTDPSANHFYGEPGMRTIYRRTLLIAPWLNPYKAVDQDGDGIVKDSGGDIFKAVPGLLRLLPTNEFPVANVRGAIAALIAFQDRYDISCRVEWDYSLQHWKIVANTLGDLTKRENRFAHYGYLVDAASSKPGRRIYPFAVISNGSGYSGNSGDVKFIADPEIGNPSDPAKATANIGLSSKEVVSYTIDPANLSNVNRRYSARPLVFIDKVPNGVPATAWAMLNNDGEVVRVTQGPAPLWGTRQGEDVMLTDALGFDLRVYDPGAPLFATWKDPSDQSKGLDVVLTPSDPGWRGDPSQDGDGGAYFHKDNMGSANGIGNNNTTFPFAGQGAYVDLGYGYDERFTPPAFPTPKYANSFATSGQSWFFERSALPDVLGNQLAPGYAVYDTWSFHYENDGLNEDDDEVENGVWQTDDHDANGTASIDEGTNGLDDYGHYSDGTFARLGIDDVGERETTPPYDKPLRGIQAVLRAYERDSRAIRQVRVNQHFLAE